MSSRRGSGAPQESPKANSFMKESNAGHDESSSRESKINTLPLLSSPRGGTKGAHTTPHRDSKLKNKDKQQSKSASTKNSGNVPAKDSTSHHNLTVTVDVPSDKPLSNPPTVTLITPHNNKTEGVSNFSPDPNPYDHLHDSIGSTSSTTPVKLEQHPTSNSVTFNTKKQSEETSLSPRHNMNSATSGSTKPILKKSTSNETQSPSASYAKDENLSQSRNHTPRDKSHKRERRHSFDGSTDGVTIEVPTEERHSILASTSPTTKRPSWLSPTSATVDDSIDVTNSNPLSSDPAVRLLQQKLDEVTIQKDTIEKYLRAEIEALKNKASVGHGNNSVKSLEDANVDRSVEYENLKLKIATLTEENSRLKEEAVVERIRHQKEVTQLREKHAGMS